jgi:HK97 family phage prohead protease
MELINITEFEAHERRQRRTRARYGFRVEEDDEPKRNQVLCGLGTAYLRPHIHRGRIEMFAPGVFAASLASGRRVNLQLDHNGGMVVATTASGLELDETDLGLFFRLDLCRTKAADVITSMVDVGNRACASVAYQVENDHTEKFGGHDVRVITRPCLDEVSLVKRGAVEGAFAFLSDDKNNPTVQGMERSTVFALDRAHHNIRRTTKAQLDYVEQLTARVDALCAEAGIATTRETDDIIAGLDRIMTNLESLRA